MESKQLKKTHFEDIGGNVLEDGDQVDGDLLVVAAALQDLEGRKGRRKTV